MTSSQDRSREEALTMNYKDIFYRLVGLWKIISSWWSGTGLPAINNQTEPSESSNKHDVSVTSPPQTTQESSPAQTIENSDAYFQSQYYTDPKADVDRINVNVKCAGKTMEVDVFPLEKVAVLLKEACEQAGKNPKKMCLIFDGNCLDVNKEVAHYRLRRGTTVNLIHS